MATSSLSIIPSYTAAAAATTMLSSLSIAPKTITAKVKLQKYQQQFSFGAVTRWVWH